MKRIPPYSHLIAAIKYLSIQDAANLSRARQVIILERYYYQIGTEPELQIYKAAGQEEGLRKQHP